MKIANPAWEAPAIVKPNETPAPVQPAQAATVPQKEETPVRRPDTAEITNTWEETQDWGKKCQTLLEQLAARYPRVTIQITASLSQDELRKAAAQLGDGGHLLITEDFLKRMASGSKAFFHGKALLEGLAGAMSQQQGFGGAGAYLDDDEMNLWRTPPEKPVFTMPDQKEQTESIFQMMKRLEAESKKRREMFSMGMRVNPGETSALFSRLAQAQSSTQVRSVISAAERNICSLRLIASFGTDQEKSKARSAIAAMQKAVLRASGKIKDLDEEEGLQIQRKKAEKAQRLKRAQQMKIDLKKKKAFRHARDQGLISEGRLLDYYTQELNRKTAYEEALDSLVGGGLELFGIPDLTAVAVAGATGSIGGVAESAVSISPTIAISI